MKRAVMLSIKPEWCDKIISGEKTIEIRKTHPKMEAPFKCYICETQGLTDTPWMDEDGHMVFRGRGKVIGEFVCDRILDVFISCSDPNMTGYPFPGTGMTDREIMDYLGNGKSGYGWHISDLKIYTESKDVNEFWRLPCERMSDCENCRKFDRANMACTRPPIITRPPQSWCYVEDMK